MVDKIPDPGPSRQTSLTHRAVRAGLSMAGMTSLESVLVLVRTLVLARLLDPREFGLMGMSFIAVNATEALSQTGFPPALVQRKDDPTPYLDTAWCVGVVRGLLLTIVTFLVAPMLGDFFRTPEVVPVLRAISFVFLLRGFMNPGWFLLERELKLARLVAPRVAGTGLDLLVTTACAFALRSVWAMVIGYVVGSALALVLTYVVRPYMPRFRFSLERFRSLRGFGKHVFRNEVLTYTVDQGDKAVVGRLLDASHLGLYSFAFRLAKLPATTVGTVMLRVVFPAFSRIQGEPERVRGAYTRLMGLVAAAVFPVAAGLAVTAPELVPVVFGSKWIPMTTTFQILSLLGAAAALDLVCGAVGGSLGRPDVAVHGSLVKILGMVAVLVPMTLGYGIDGAAGAMLVAGAVATWFVVWKVTKLAGVEASALGTCLGVPALACAGMTAAVGGSRVLWEGAGPLRLVIEILIGAVAYLLLAYAADRALGGTIMFAAASVVRSQGRVSDVPAAVQTTTQAGIDVKDERIEENLPLP